MHPAKTYLSDDAKINEHQMQGKLPFSGNVNRPTFTTVPENKPLLPSVCHPNSTLYTTPTDLTISRPYLSNVAGYNPLNHSNTPPIPPFVLPRGYDSLNNHNVSYNPLPPYEIATQNRVLPFPRNNAPCLVPLRHSSEVYKHGQIPAPTMIPAHGLATNTNLAPLSLRNSNESRRFEGVAKSHVEQSLPTQGSFDVMGMNPQYDVYDIPDIVRGQGYNPTIPYPGFQSDSPSQLHAIRKPSYAKNEMMERSSDLANKDWPSTLNRNVPFFGDCSLQPRNSSGGSFEGEKAVVVTNREPITGKDYVLDTGYPVNNESYANKGSIAGSSYLSEDNEPYLHSERMEERYSPSYETDNTMYDRVASYDMVEKDISRRSYSADRSSCEDIQRYSQLKTRSFDARGRLKERSTSTQGYSRRSSRDRNRSRSPAERHRYSSSRKSVERTERERERQDRRERRRVSPERKRDSSRDKETRSDTSLRQRSESLDRTRSKISDNKLTEVKEEKRTVSSPKRPNVNDKDTRRALKCFVLPEPNIERKFVYEQSSRYYQASSSSQKSTSSATEKVAKLHTEFKEMLSKSQNVEDCPATTSEMTALDPVQNPEEDSQYVSELLNKKDDDDSSESEVDLEGYDVIDEYDSDEESEDDGTPLPTKIRFKNQEYPRKLHPEMWFNVEGELNHGKECLCSLKDKNKWIVHNVYPNEQLPRPCEAMGNNGLQLYHYWVTVFPHPNFMTENPTKIECNGRTYTFEGFSLLSHSPLGAVPRCFLTRFNFKYEVFFIQEPIPTNFCIRDLDLFSNFLFKDILEMHDWKIEMDKESEEHCSLFHFLPRFTNRTGTSDGCEKYELLSMRKVFEYLKMSFEPLISEKTLASEGESWKDFVSSCVNSVVTRPGWKPSSIRIDDLERSQDKDNPNPIIIHHGIRPVQLSFSGDPKCQKLMKSYLKMRILIMNKPDATQKERLQLKKMKLTLDNMRMKDSLRRNCCVRVSSTGMMRTGLNSDITQHALLLPVLVHHVRYHLSLQSFDEKIGYVFKDRALLQLALTHPSYVMNYGTNPDHARNTLSNCGVKQPRYGDRRNRLNQSRKKGIVRLIDIMAKLEDLDGSHSFIQHNERLEFLGDAILEFVATCHLYFLFPDMAEGGLVTHRSSLVQNKHLAHVAKKIGLDDFMQFSHGPDLCHQEDMEHAMANCLEAILGAIYLDSDVNTVQKVFCKLAFEESELRKLWCSLPRHPLQEQQPDGDRQFISSSDMLKRLVKLEEAIGMQFKHIRLLARAFTHPQVGYNHLTLGNNQRMELLGDSLVQWVVTAYLYRHFPKHHEGHLTLLRSSLVNRTIQAQIAGEIGLDQYVHFGVGPGVQKIRQKHMSDLFEAFLAALFVDKGIEPVEVFCKVCLFPRLRNVIVNQEWMDFKSQLQSCCLTQSQFSHNVPIYKVLKDVGSPNMKLYTVGVYFNGKRLGTGFGDSIREAEMNAAQNALATNYFPEFARQKRVLRRKHNHRTKRAK
ncbi:ribonuclease 3-like isoform X2 [Dendronephthya gigantea]|uniref:ribonuclease 3-like isoform X2 n=1 Tax=Dendronephthya gigantea TaxID=151771 RepID=UPI00106D74A8|nr:ribonuclease 3-like isoform X2 [Dendronephthya gigantea]